MSRRGHNEGSIHQRKDGYWAGVIDMGRDSKGKRKRKYIYGKTRREVSERMKELLRDQQQGLPILTGKHSLEQFVTSWLEDEIKPTLREKTYVSYEGICRLHILPGLGHVNLQELTRQQVQRLVNDKAAAGLSKHIVTDIHAVLRRALNQALEWDLVARNVATLVKPPRIEEKELHYLTPEQARKLIQTVQGDRLEALYTVALALGLRRGEALGMRWQDVDLDKGILSV